MSIEIIGLRFTHRKSINPSLYGPFFNYFGGGILRYYLQFSLPVNNSKTLLYVFVSRYHTTCYHKDRQYFQILAAVTAIMSARGLCHTPGARFPFMGSLLPAQCRCTLAQCELRGFRFWIINTVAAGPVQYQPFISNQHYGNNITIKRTSPDKPQH